MKSSNSFWKEKLAEQMPEHLAREIDIFETEITLRKQGKLEERLFAETRLRRGAYGQRYDNGQRSDGQKVQKLNFSSGDLTKGPNTMWDAPGMQRIKVPGGGLNAAQLEVMAELAEEYSDGIAHVTTRQDFQLHYVHIDDAPALMRRLATADITTREACGNSVRNVTACPYAGVCTDEAFDVTPYAQALAKFLLGHPDCQSFGRKFKPAFSGCAQHACGLTGLHDLGLIAKSRVNEVTGREELGFEMYVGGGLGAVPYQAKLFDSFVPPDELLPLAQAIARVFARHGEKKNRNRARIKFLIQDLGIEKFRELVREERKILPFDPRWTEYIREARAEFAEGPLKPAVNVPELVLINSANGSGPELQKWLKFNTRPQRQPGFVTVTVALPLGDITANQLRSLADIVRRFTRETIRTTVEQNFVIRWVSKGDLPELYKALHAVGLGDAGAGALVDITSCPGTDTCKLGISSSRGLAAELRRRVSEKSFTSDQAIQNLHIKISGCFNSCGQHHVADLGFYGVSRKIAGYAVPHFQVVLGGQWEQNAGSYGLPVVAVPSKNIPIVVSRLTERYLADRTNGETFKDFVMRTGKAQLKVLLEDLTKPPAGDRSFFSDWGDPREYTLGDLGDGECAGEVVSALDFGLAAAERELFEAQLAHEKGEVEVAGRSAYHAMVTAAKALVQIENADVGNNPDQIVQEFRTRYYDTQLFFDPFAGGKFANYLFDAHRKTGQQYTSESSRYLIDEAQLFIDAAHSCSNRLGTLVSA
ncbi:MAG: sulfite reductase [Acidobacteria bacterium]|nr:MAG: sulfite reductase [Acidobacteriota bacterium]PYV75280.1 MAG: sulfite reductase [Acidobacteriota bacterium]